MFNFFGFYKIEYRIGKIIWLIIVGKIEVRIYEKILFEYEDKIWLVGFSDEISLKRFD